MYLVYVIALSMALLEIALLKRSSQPKYSTKESLSSLGVAIGHRISSGIFAGMTFSIYLFVWQYRLWTIPLDNLWAWLGLFLGLEFFYYWYHRASHEIRWLWATHAVHHSSHYFNLSAAYRLGWTGVFSGNFLFFLPLAWLGFHPINILVGLALNLLYQFWIHTELIGRLGPLEWILNTPSHHRVHHASNLEYIDRNYGGVLIVFDRLFGTFTPENKHLRPIYGLTHPLYSGNPFRIAFAEWFRLFQDLSQARSWRDRRRVILGRPT
jgi:sterol desaturase/sphingolipid hydroxylase (fatty acid hydroxylase superfamily)